MTANITTHHLMIEEYVKNLCCIQPKMIFVVEEKRDMLNKKERTLKTYMKIGAEMRLFKEIGMKLATDASDVLSAPDRQILTHALGTVDSICSKAESNMFRDHPYVSNNYINVFYGSIRKDPANEVDKEVIHIAKEIANKLFHNS